MLDGEKKTNADCQRVDSPSPLEQALSVCGGAVGGGVFVCVVGVPGHTTGSETSVSAVIN